MSGEPDTISAPSLPIATFLRVALRVLSLRVQQWATLLLTFGLFAWGMVDPSWIRLASAVAFTLLAHVPLWFLRKEPRHADS